MDAVRPPVFPMTIARVFDRALADDPHREALVTRTARCSYAELDRACDQAAGALRSLGVAAGDRVAVSLPNEIDVVLAFHGAMRLGAIWVGVNRALAAPERAFLLDDSDSTLLLSDDEVPSSPVRRVGIDEWRATVAAHPPEPLPEPLQLEIDPFAPAGIAYTSGTTGRPKGAVHSQWNLLLPGASLVASRGYGPELRKADCLPLTILNLQVLTTLLTAQAGGTCIVMDRLDPVGIAEWIRAERATTWNGPPALLHSLAGSDEVAPDDLASLDEVWNGGADCPTAIRHRFEAKFGGEILCTYGLSEAPAVVSIDPRGGPHRDGSSGRPLPHLRVEVIDDTGAALAAGETGEVVVRAADDRYRPMLGYWGRDEATAAVLAGGVLRTGDVGFVDADGELHIRDRKTLVILRGGANVYPAEVERVLHEVPGVAACAVVGVPDERLGERVVAAIELDPGAAWDEAAARSHAEAHLARYKLPERYVVVDAFPRNAMGKIARAALPSLLAP